MEAHRGQRFDLVFGEVNPYLAVRAIGGPDRYRNLLAPPQVTLLQEHVRDVMVGRIDHKPLDRPDPPIARVHSVAATYLYLANRYAVGEHPFPMMAERQADASQAVIRPGVGMLGVPLGARVSLSDHIGGRKKLDVLRLIKPLELLLRAAEPDPVFLDVRDEVDVHEPCLLLVAPGLNDEMREHIGDRVEDHPGQMPAMPVGGVDVSANFETFAFAG